MSKAKCPYKLNINKIKTTFYIARYKSNNGKVTINKISTP